MATIENWGVVDEGFYCPTYEEILNDKIKRAKDLFGDDVSTNQLTALGKLLRIEAANDRKIYETAEQIYYSNSPATATGVSLERLGSFINLTRNTAVCAVHKILVYGDYNYIISAGTLFRNAAGITFWAVSDATINNTVEDEDENSYHYAEVTVQCTSAGTDGNVSNINAPVIANSAITSVVHSEQITEGADAETDANFRARYASVVQGLGSSTASSIAANVLRLNSVQACIVKDNNTDEDIVVSDDLTITSGTYAVIVYTTDTSDDMANEIAAAIFEKQPLGVVQSGIEKITVQDDAGEWHNVLFTYVTEKSVDVAVSCNVTNEFETDGETQIVDNITDYINGLGIGDTLVYTKLYECIYKVTGVDSVDELTISVDDEEISGNLEASLIEIIQCGDVTVETVEV